MTNKLSSVTFSGTTHNAQTFNLTYWFDAKVPDHECTAICFGLSASGEWVSASSTFFELECPTKKELLSIGRRLLKRVLN